ncbi:hypothetical protein WN093_14595, partial [Gammaproteobacteria bacterium AS21]
GAAGIAKRLKALLSTHCRSSHLQQNIGLDSKLRLRTPSRFTTPSFSLYNQYDDSPSLLFLKHIKKTSYTKCTGFFFV